MSILRKLEKKLENAVEGIFTKGFKSKVEPVELGKKMAHEMINGKVVALKKAWAPNNFTIKLSKEDDEIYSTYKKQLLHELADFLVQEAAAECLAMNGRPKIIFEQDENLGRGQFSIEASLSDEFEKEISKTQDGATQVIDIEELKTLLTRHYIQLDGSSLKYDLKEGRSFIGRSEISDIAIADPLLSRKHVEIFIDGDEAIIKDMGSTNGTKVNGKEMKSHVLKDNDKIEAGSTVFTYRRANG